MEMKLPSWRGKGLDSRRDSHGKYTAMTGSDALLYIPVSVEQNAIYKITLEIARKSGNGFLYCNIYGNRNFDFPHAKFVCDSPNWTSYSLEIQTGDFPKTVPMTFRIWRKPNGTGSILIRRIVVERLDESEISGNVSNGMTPVRKEEIGPVETPQSISTKPPSKPSIDSSDAPAVADRSPQPRRRAPERRPRRVPAGGITNAGETKPRTRPKRNRHPKLKRPVMPARDPIPLPPLEPGIDGIKNSVIISTRDRADFLDRSLHTYARQTMSKKEFEIIILDDNSTEDILGLCKFHAKESGLQFQYIKVDVSKGAIEQRGWTPALTNNIGFKHARGSVVIITGPETLQDTGNMVYSWKACTEPKCIYGIVYRSTPSFVDAIKAKKDWMEYGSFNEILSIPGAKHERPDGFWWYYTAVRKEYVLYINGVDERYMLGIAAEDDDFAERMKLSGVGLAHDQRIIGIHQDHTREDRQHPAHAFRFNKKLWNELREHNCRLLDECIQQTDPIVNKSIDWGTEKAIICKEIF